MQYRKWQTQRTLDKVKEIREETLLRIIVEYENDDRIADYDSSRTKVMKTKFAYH